MQIPVVKDALISLGGGKFARADRIIGMVPIEGEERGAGRRTRVLLDHEYGILIVGRTERSIIPDMQIKEAGQEETPFEANSYIDALEEIHTSLQNISPAMRAVLKDQGCDVDLLIQTIQKVVNYEEMVDNEQEDELI